MEYNFKVIEPKWRAFWQENKTYKVTEDNTKPKFYVLDMFPYPSGAGLHVGHPLGYIASDIYARYKKMKGFNVLHPMGYDSFGLPAEQYAIQTGQHPAITTAQNTERYRNQLDLIGFGYDWDREVKTSDPSYYKWTQWIFKQLFNAWYNIETDKAEPITSLVERFSQEGNLKIKAQHDCTLHFTAEEWRGFSQEKKEEILLTYRLAYLSDTWVNWCEALGTVLANDEVKDGFSVRGGHPVARKQMRQWSMRITAYADRLLEGLNRVDWSESIKEQQRNWIGRSQGAMVNFTLADFPEEKIMVFTTRPDTIFGVSFMVLAPEHELVNKITTAQQKESIEAYKLKAAQKSERDRMAEKEISGCFTGAYVLHPFSGEKIPVWIGDYVLAGYGTGAVMAVPCGDQRDFNFAKHFNLPIPSIFKDIDTTEQAYADKVGKITNSDFLNDLDIPQALQKAVEEIENRGLGYAKINFRIRDAVFSRQRYWGEPFPVYYENGLPQLLEDSELPLTLPPVDKYLPTESGEPPLARAKQEDWPIFKGERMEYNTMPGWAGSSWYFIRYMDPKNDNAIADPEKIKYWDAVDLYIGGSEHATGHLLYSRFWTKFLFDLGYIPFDEPFKKMINQGMILGRSSLVYREKGTNVFISADKIEGREVYPIHVDISLVDNDLLDVESFKQWREEYKDAQFILSDEGSFKCIHEIEKMSKSLYNVQTPDDLVEKFGADTLRMYEMFLGPIEQAKPWDTKGINGVHNFLRKFWRLFHKSEVFTVTEEEPNKAELKLLHGFIKKYGDDVERYSFNTVVSGFMIVTNELSAMGSNKRAVLEPLVKLLSPFAPHIAEELYALLGHKESVSLTNIPTFNPAYLVDDTFVYPVSFNGKTRFNIEVDANLGPKEVESIALTHESAAKWLEGKTPKKVIVVPKRIVNIVL
ncbi:MAG: leucine--tRNA ligase [Luteibaculaceae bacterium]